MRWADVGPFVTIVFAGSVYVALIAAQGGPVETVSWVVACSVVAAAATAAAGFVTEDPRARIAYFGLTGLTALTWTVLGAASIGMAFVPALVLSVLSLRRAQKRD